MDWLQLAIPQPDPGYFQQAQQHQLQLTKPAGSLGRLEEIAARLAAMQGSNTPTLERIWISVFAADHGIAEESVSAFPQAVTAEMVRNFSVGGAAINVLAQQIDARLEIIDVGIQQPLSLNKLIVARAGNGTRNFLEHPAMTEMQLKQSLDAGREAVGRALAAQVQLYIGGEMGIANTTSATAMACVLSGIAAAELTGAGTGLNDDGIRHKTAIIEQALSRHQACLNNPMAVLRHLGGFEIAALVASYIMAAQHRLPVLIDGFIATVAALLAVKINQQAGSWFFYAHRSKEKGHQAILQQLDAQPILDLDMRLGEGSGAAVAVSLLRSACLLHNQMATFSQAQVSKSTVQ